MAKKKAETAAVAEGQVPAAPPVTAAPAAPVAKDEKHGVTRPSSGKTLRVWQVADEMSKAKKAPVERAELTEALLKEGLVVGTIHTQYGKWRKYLGLVGAPKPAKEPKAPKAKKEKAAPAADAPAPEVPAVPEVPAPAATE